jgi:hypothetical protein
MRDRDGALPRAIREAIQAYHVATTPDAVRLVTRTDAPGDGITTNALIAGLPGPAPLHWVTARVA